MTSYNQSLKVKMNFRETLRMWREKRYLTQKQLADKANVGVTSVRYYEEGKAQPTLGMLKLLSKALEISVAELVGDE